MAISKKLGDLYVEFGQKNKDIVAKDIDSFAGQVQALRDGTLRNTTAIKEAFAKMGEGLASQFLSSRLEQIVTLTTSGALKIGEAEALIGRAIQDAGQKHDAWTKAMIENEKKLAKATQEAAKAKQEQEKQLRQGITLFGMLEGALMGFVRSGLAGTTAGDALNQRMQLLSREIAATLLPVIEKLLDILDYLVGWFKNLSGTGQTVIGIIIALVVVLYTLSAILPVAAIGFKLLATAIAATMASTGIGGLLVLLGAIAAVLGVIIASFAKVKSQRMELAMSNAGFEGVAETYRRFQIAGARSIGAGGELTEANRHLAAIERNTGHGNGSEGVDIPPGIAPVA